MTDKPYSETIDEATPRPWTLNGFNLSQVIRIEEGPDEKGRSYIDGRHQVEVISFRSMADARLAVQAVNAHDGLVAENKRLRAELAEAIRAHDSVSFEAGERSMRDAAVKIAAQYVAYNPNTKFAVIKTHIAQRILDKLRKLPIKIKVTEIVDANEKLVKEMKDGSK